MHLPGPWLNTSGYVFILPQKKISQKLPGQLWSKNIDLLKKISIYQSISCIGKNIFLEDAFKFDWEIGIIYRVTLDILKW